MPLSTEIYNKAERDERGGPKIHLGPNYPESCVHVCGYISGANERAFEGIFVICAPACERAE